MADTSLHGCARLPGDEEDWPAVLEEVEGEEPTAAAALLLERNGELALALQAKGGELERVRRSLTAVAAARDRAEARVVYWRMTSAAVAALCLLLLCLFAMEAWG